MGEVPEVGHHYRVRVHGDDIERVFEGETICLPMIEFSATVTMIVPDLDGRPITDWIWFDNGVVLRRWDNATFEDAPCERGSGWHYTSA